MKRVVYSLISAFLLIVGLMYFTNSFAGITALVIIDNHSQAQNTNIGTLFVLSSVMVAYLGSRTKKKGQAAMEFLMTYGWAILAAILAIGVLASIGIFNVDMLRQDTIILSPPFYANAWEITGDNIQLEIKNNAGSSYTLTSVTIEGCGTQQINQNIGSGELYVINLDCTNPISSGSFKGEIKVSYTKPGSSVEMISKGTASGSISDSNQQQQAEECSDALDNDDDGAIDNADYSCSQGEVTEGSLSAECQDSQDNDVDGTIDLDDADCTDSNDNSETGNLGGDDEGGGDVG